MKRQLNMTKSRRGGVFVPIINLPMAINRRSVDDSEGKRRDRRLICGGVPVGYKGILLYFP